MIARRSLMLAAPGIVMGRGAATAPETLRVGDQKGGTQSVMKAANALDGTASTPSTTASP